MVVDNGKVKLVHKGNDIKAMTNDRSLQPPETTDFAKDKQTHQRSSAIDIVVTVVRCW